MTCIYWAPHKGMTRHFFGKHYLLRLLTEKAKLSWPIQREYSTAFPKAQICLKDGENIRVMDIYKESTHTASQERLVFSDNPLLLCLTNGDGNPHPKYHIYPSELSQIGGSNERYRHARSIHRSACRSVPDLWTLSGQKVGC
ncbi:hypothetical protein SDC9_66774 [bioreactor metagenome]|uniref:Uncharacterized protein n=1 Tax=bioreactor metagenome TaxID=1076179 RepID=A0A644XVY2_9ZZZZ